MIIIWLVIGLYKIFAVNETTSKGNSNLKDNEDKSQLTKLTKTICLHISSLQQFLVTLHPTLLEASLLRAKSVNENKDSSESHNNLRFRVEEENIKQLVFNSSKELNSSGVFCAKVTFGP